jgi:hypothetical protein
MLPSKEVLSEKFNEYNSLYFNGDLGKMTKRNFFYIQKNSHCCGRFMLKPGKNGKDVCQIWIGKCIEWNEERLREVLVHEMIHMYNTTVEHSKHDGLFGHGRKFRRQCRRLKRDFGLTIYVHCPYDYITMPPPSKFEKALLWLIDR